MSWYRVHNDVLENPKLLMLAPSDRWYFIAILSLKSQGVLDKYQGEKLDRVLCAKLRLTKDEWSECARRLQEEGLIGPGFQPSGWDERQFQSDSSTERVRKHRAKLKNVGETKRNANETKMKRKKSGNETSGEPEGNKKGTTSEASATRTASGVANNETQPQRQSNDDETLQKRQRNGIEAPPDTDTDTDNTNSDPASAVSATSAANSVDNFKSIQVDYQSPSADQLIFNRGAEFLGRYKIPDEAARKFLGMCKSKFGLGRTLDAVVVSIFSQPARDPKAFVLGVLANQPRPIDQTWGPSDATVSELEGLGMPPDLIKNARGVFVTWFSDMEIQHSDWPRLFKDWVIRDWERAEFKKHQYRTILAASAGLEYGTPFCEPPGGTL